MVAICTTCEIKNNLHFARSVCLRVSSDAWNKAVISLNNITGWPQFIHHISGTSKHKVYEIQRIG
jgi:hypothetical protein